MTDPQLEPLTDLPAFEFALQGQANIAPGHLPRTSITFVAPAGPHEWLNRAVFVGTLLATPDMGCVRVRVDRVV